MGTEYDPKRHHRRSLRLTEYDYASAGVYFITICTQNRECLLGHADDSGMHLNAAGKMVAEMWDDIPSRFPDVVLDAVVVMPNHVHGIIVLTDPTEGPSPVATRPTLGAVAGAFKSSTTVAYVRGVEAHGWQRFRGRLWQRNFYEHVIRDETSMNRIREYIAENPTLWADDPENPAREPERGR